MSEGTMREIEASLCAEIARLLETDTADVQPDNSLGELGLDSVGFVELSRFIQQQYGQSLPPDALYEHPSIRHTVEWLASRGAALSPAKADPARSDESDGRNDVAIVGVSFRLPGASDWNALAQLLEGEPAFEPVPSSRWPARGPTPYPDTLRAGVLDDVARFDAAFFGISPREALAMDPQQRLLMECGWQALEDAGLTPEQWQGTRTSVYVGASGFDYAELLSQTEAGRASHIGTGLSHAILANRLSQYFNVVGSSETLDTACSSSLVALWRAAREIRTGEADMALVAGVNVFASPTPFKAFSEAGMLNPDGACLPFDERASGYVRGEGVVALVLKPLDRVREEGGTVLGVIRGGAVRHSGRTQSLTAPNPEAQADVIQAALDSAGVTADAIGYVEAHGTGTSLGDPIEIRGLKKVFDQGIEREPAPCRISSIKSQIGHLEAAAGLAGVVKVLHCFRHRQLPGNPQLRRLNPLIDLERSRVSIDFERAPWTLSSEQSDRRRLAGVSSFGFGGTNAHMILEEPPEGLARSGDEKPRHVFGGERFWPAFDVESNTEATQPGFECRRLQWVAEPLPQSASGSADSGRVAWVLAAGSRGASVADALVHREPSWQWSILDWSRLSEASQSDAHPDIWFDLSALDEGPDRTSATTVDRLSVFAQRLGPALKSGETMSLIQATARLRDLGDAGFPCRSLAGAAMTAWYESLASEYRHCLSKSVDFADANMEPDELAHRLLLELDRPEEERAVAYADNRRWLPQWATVTLTEHPPTSVAGAVAVVTGGLGDIGRVLTEDLIRRSVKAILLTGRRPVTREIDQQLARWREQGVAVEYASVELTDASAVYSVLDRFKEHQGPITHVFHCAGHVDDQTVAFYRKSKASMSAVFEPKVDALNTLHEYFIERPPKQIVLFSSISAAEPDKAVGLLDYAAANRYLDAYAAYRNQQGPAIYRSIQWDVWSSTAMGAKARQGLDGRPELASEDALDALYRIVGSENPSATLGVQAVASAKPTEPATATEPVSRAESRPAPQATATADDLLPELRRLMAVELETDEARLDDDASFNDLGLDSIVLIDVIRSIEQWVGQTIDPEALIRCDSIAATARYLADRGAVPSAVTDNPDTVTSPGVAEPSTKYAHASEPFKVAVIGLDCRVPGASDPLAFWNNLNAGVDSVVEIPTGQRRDRPARPDEPPRWAGLIDGYDHLYPKLFDVTPDEAADVDPLVRLFTECGLSAIHDSSVGLDGVKGERVGVFAGARASRYAERIVRPGKRSITGVGQNFIAAYISHALDLHGPNLVVDTACSSSLTAIHLACAGLKAGDCDVAVAGGVDVLLDQKTHDFLASARALSPDGRCRPFSARANGFVPGEGVGAVLLKPLDRALDDGDRIYAVVDGSALNNDGDTLGITTPGADGQADVIRRALAASQVAPSDISYVEAHGTGTMIGDPIELQSLARAYQTDPPERCGVGSVKSNVGHLLSAAGAASFIKVVLALHHRTLPPTLHCDEINPRIGFDRLPFYPVRRSQPWPAGRAGRKAGISAFGFGKTNVHLVVSERPEQAPVPELRRRPLPVELCGERVRAWHETEGVAHPEERSNRPLLAVENILVEELT